MKKVAGFTLIELLLVLVLIGIGSGLAIASVDRLAGRTEELRLLDRTQQELRRLRNKAVLSGITVQATVHFDRRTISSRSRTTLELPERYRFYPVTGSPLSDSSQAADQLELLFYPDGTTREANFGVLTPSGLHQEFHLERISGRIERLNVAATQ